MSKPSPGLTSSVVAGGFSIASTSSRASTRMNATSRSPSSGRALVEHALAERVLDRDRAAAFEPERRGVAVDAEDHLSF